MVSEVSVMFQSRDIHSTGLKRDRRITIMLGVDEYAALEAMCAGKTSMSEGIRRAIGYTILNLGAFKGAEVRLTRGEGHSTRTISMNVQEYEEFENARGDASQSQFVREAIMFMAKNVKDANRSYPARELMRSDPVTVAS